MLPGAPYLSFIIPLVSALLVPIVATINPKTRGWFAVIVSFTSAALTLSMIPDVLAASEGHVLEITIPWVPSMNLNFGVLVDPLSVFMANVATCIGSLIMLYSVGYMAHEEDLTRYYFLKLLFIGSMVGLVMASNFLQVIFFWEIVGVCSYNLISFWYNKPSAAKAGMKAFIVTAVGDTAFLIGILLIYLQTGSLNFFEIKGVVEAGKIALPLLSIISVLIFGGAIGKSAQFPLHVWLPDAMEGPTTVSALIHAATMVNAGVFLVARTHMLFAGVHVWLTTVMYIGGITAFIAATMALVNVDVKRVLAYSTISQLGLMITALGIGTETGWLGSQFHILSHGLFKALLFLCAGSILHSTGTTDIRQMGGLRKAMPITFAASFIGVLSLSGIPPLNGFWSKDLIIAAAYEAQLMPILIIIVLTSILTVAYSVRWISLIFLGEMSEYLRGHHVHESPLIMTAPLIILAAASCVSGFLLSGFANFMHIEHEAGIELIPILFTIFAIAIGGLPAYFTYYRKTFSPKTLSSGRIGKAIYSLLSNGYFFDAMYHKIFVDGLLRLSKAVFKYVELIFDKFNYAVANMSLNFARWLYHRPEVLMTDNFNYGFARFMLAFSTVSDKFDMKVVDGAVNGIASIAVRFVATLRRIQTGVIQQYILTYIAGIIFLVLLIVLKILNVW